jgi:hypothetical protein
MPTPPESVRQDPLLRLSIAQSQLTRVEEVVSSMYARLHHLTETWGRANDQGEDTVYAKDVEQMIRAVQREIVEAGLYLGSVARADAS